MKKWIFLALLLAGSAHAQYTIAPYAGEIFASDNDIQSVAYNGVYVNGTLDTYDFLSTATAATNGSVMVGGATMPYVVPSEAVIWQNGLNAPPTDLNGAWLPSNSYLLMDAFAINAQGQILVEGIGPTSRGGNDIKEYVLTPTPEIDWARAVTALTLLIGGVLVLKAQHR